MQCTGQLSFSVRASPERVNGNYECKVCVNLGFYQHAYISLALIVNGEPSCDVCILYCNTKFIILYSIHVRTYIYSCFA